MKLFEMYKMGGPYMNLISLMALTILIVAGIKIFRMAVYKDYSRKLLGLVIMAGSFAVAMGMLSQILGIVQALEAIRQAGDISPQLVMGGAIISFYSTIWGFVIFLFSLLFYFILKEIAGHKGS